MDPEISITPLPFDEAIEFFKAKGIRLSPNSWRDVWAAEHVQAFTVARVTAMDVLEDIRKEVLRALEKGTSLVEFKRDLRKTLTAKGWYAARDEEPELDGRKRLTPWRLETIYRTNLQGAYAAGRYKQMIEAAQDRPYWRYEAVNDARTRPSHAAQDGKVYRFDHPFWDKWYPPNGFNCRCTVVSLSSREMERQGLHEQTRGPSHEPDKGFDYNVGLKAWKPDFSKYSPEGKKILLDLSLDAPQNVSDLSIWMNRMLEGYKQSGMPGTSAPIQILEDRRTEYRGWANYDNGQIGLHPDIYRTVSQVLRKGRAETAKEMDDFKTLVHEYGHQLGYRIDWVRYNADPKFRILCQAVNDLWARHSLPEIMKALKIDYARREAERILVHHPSGYQKHVERLRLILRKAGLDEVDEKILMTDLNLAVSTVDFSDRLWGAIRQKKPAIIPSGNFGMVLDEEAKFEWLMGELG